MRSLRQPREYPYTRYFLAHILQFQFHRALCKAAGIEGPLHRCSVYGSAEAGARLAAMLEMGASEAWPEALEEIVGTREMDATAILDYFSPLSVWFVNGNRNPHICGNRKLHTSGEDVSDGADILPVMLVGRFGLDAGSGATGVLANTRREAAEPAVTVRLPHAVRPTLSSASADAPASGSCCPGC